MARFIFVTLCGCAGAMILLLVIAANKYETRIENAEMLCGEWARDQGLIVNSPARCGPVHDDIVLRFTVGLFYGMHTRCVFSAPCPQSRLCVFPLTGLGFTHAARA
jgi:hypothetical protein